jgi:hypothetical protein
MSWKTLFSTTTTRVNDIPESRYQKNSSSGSIKVKTTKHPIRVGDRGRILKSKQTFRTIQSTVLQCILLSVETVTRIQFQITKVMFLESLTNI